jgi:sodium/potassium/calcium exchanger 6
LVHQAKDQCAFIKQNCPDEDAGLFSYLQLYYCDLAHIKPVAFTIIVLWLCLLFSTIGIAASDFFCINLSTIAHLLGLSESLAGVTFLAFGNGSPDVFSTFAAMSTNSGSLAVGELIGAASFITAVVAGAMAFVRPFKVARRSFVRDVSFFILAASFSMAFLIDGMLTLWEAAAMVGLYIFYVIFVVVWHWWFNRRKLRKQAEAAARAQFVATGSEIAEFPAYHDEDEPEQEGRHSPRRGLSAEDISLLERGRGDANEEDEEAEEDRGKRELGEINSEMRLGRPRLRDRRGTHNPVRPSLIGALEFRSILSGLQRSGNIQSFPLHRRHSDDGRVDNSRFNDARSMTSEPASHRVFHANPEEGGMWNVGQQHSDAVEGLRTRAISAPDPAMIRQAAKNVPSIDLLGPLSEDDALSRGSPRHQDTDHLTVPTSPSVSLSPPLSSQGSRSNSPAPSHARSTSSSAHLAVPDPFAHQPHHAQPEPLDIHAPIDSANGTSTAKPQRPVLRIPSGSPAFVPHSDEVSPSGRTPSIRLPSPHTVLTDEHPIEQLFRSSSPKPPKWWPSYLLPTPFELWATLFPTLCGWTEKNWWERLLGIVAAPSIFFLTITLPVVETESEEDNADDDIPDLTLPGTYENAANVVEGDRSYASSVPILIEPEADDGHSNHEFHNVAGPFSKGLAGHGTTATVAASNEALHQHAQHEPEGAPPHPHHSRHHLPIILSPVDRQITKSPDQLPAAAKLPSSRDWNRWLVILQVFTAPFFIALIFWAKMDEGEPRELVRPVLISLVCSLAVLAVILATTTPAHAPKWRAGLCFMGFIVSITWISSIADEVVGVLKSIGVILNISDAILGLTIFAVGNSLGDLVADYTVAKLGYPVMALSACFGGPMLNILLGVGLSGCYLTIKHARKRQEKHPEREMKFKPYEIEVSRTLMISGATLLVTLLGLLIVVPLRRWKMDRFVGICLVMLWTVSTVCNVIVEVLGFGANA